MRRTGAHGTDFERGQASVEFLATLPAALLVAAIAWQLLLAGQASWLTANAARVAVRAQVVGGDPESAARGALPSYLRRQLEVSSNAEGSGRVKVRVRVPLLFEGWDSPLEVGATAAMVPQGP
jgi:hypothetical protein